MSANRTTAQATGAWLPGDAGSIALSHAAAPAGEGTASAQMYRRLGELTRSLHDALRELDLDTKLEAAKLSLPDARDRLAYVSALTEQAANRVLTAVEEGQADQALLASAAATLAALWTRHASGALSAAEREALVEGTRALLDDMPRRTGSMRSQLHEIMMAQDFHDRTGQVLGRIGALMHTLEGSLLAILVESRPDGAREEAPGGLSGPAIRASSDVAANQGEVDDLLDSLGF